MLHGWFLWFIILWSFFLVFCFAVGGYFMFRKFLKKIPKADGRSIMDWEEYYVKESLPLWQDEEKAFLNELVSPVPELFRDVAKHKIAGKIGELALNENASKITKDLVIKGYIQATPKRDHKFLRKRLSEKHIDISPFEHLF